MPVPLLVLISSDYLPSPTAGDTYGPGAYILGEWSTSVEVSSPSFQLCLDGEAESDPQDLGDACGTTVQPAVQQDPDTGSFQITLYGLKGKRPLWSVFFPTYFKMLEDMRTIS